jgi:hypothetical protein
LLIDHAPLITAGHAPLADSASSLYTTGFPIHSIARFAQFGAQGRDWR